MIGGGGADSLLGGVGDDALQGGSGDDSLFGGPGGDTMMGGAGDDLLDGRVMDGAADTDGRDFLNGGDGDDRVVLGADDWANGGAGEDTFVLGDWMTLGEQTATIDDFDPAADRLTVVYDPAAHPDPRLTVERGATPYDRASLLLDGFVIAELPGNPALSLADIDLVPSPTPYAA